jgi:hypothetical protein
MQSAHGANRASNPDNAPHLKFVDMGGHGHAVVSAGADSIQTEFVCIPRPITRATPDGGPLRYHVRHTAQTWTAEKRPELIQEIIEGDTGLSVLLGDRGRAVCAWLRTGGQGVLHLQRSTRRIRDVAATPGAVRSLHGTNRGARAAHVPAEMKRSAAAQCQSSCDGDVRAGAKGECRSTKILPVE